MRGNRKRDTGPELALRSALHAQGLRYRVGTTVMASGIRVRPDVVFGRRKVAVFVDGCLWHRCPEHGTTPRVNTDYWLPKLARNVERDQRVNAALANGGWEVLRIWEHEIRADPSAVAARVQLSVGRRRGP